MILYFFNAVVENIFHNSSRRPMHYKKNLWNEASERFSEYVNNLREIQKIDVNAMTREILTDKEK